MQAHFTVIGTPQGKARPRVTRNRRTGQSVTYTPEQTVMYENLVRLSYDSQCRGTKLSGAISAEIVAYFPIPQSVSKKKHADMAAGLIPHTKKPDCDNIAKAILDSLNDIAYGDDSQVVTLSVKKLYSEEPRAEITLTEADEK